MQLKAILEIKGQIELQSGLHIGAGKDSVEIGGLDNPVIKNPLTNAPYIPGSSLKGKMRSLLETSLLQSRPDTRRFYEKGQPCGCAKADCPVCLIFGVSAAGQTKSELGPTRILVRDSLLTTEFADLFKKAALPMEIKYENSINRCTGVAMPRPLERVPAGVCFDLNISFKIFQDDPADLVEWLFKGLRLVELDALGGCGSRGCGEVRFKNLFINDELKHENLDGIAIF